MRLRAGGRVFGVCVTYINGNSNYLFPLLLIPNPDNPSLEEVRTLSLYAIAFVLALQEKIYHPIYIRPLTCVKPPCPPRPRHDKLVREFVGRRIGKILLGLRLGEETGRSGGKPGRTACLGRIQRSAPGARLFVTMVWLLSFFFFFSLCYCFSLSLKPCYAHQERKKKKALCICILYVVVDICG